MLLFENNIMQHEKVAVVTGSSSGIGFETSLLFARNGFYTYATMRNIDKSNKITDLVKRGNLPLEVSQLDVSNDESQQLSLLFPPFLFGIVKSSQFVL